MFSMFFMKGGGRSSESQSARPYLYICKYTLACASFLACSVRTGRILLMFFAVGEVFMREPRGGRGGGGVTHTRVVYVAWRRGARCSQQGTAHILFEGSTCMVLGFCPTIAGHSIHTYMHVRGRLVDRIVDTPACLPQDKTRQDMSAFFFFLRA